jgi:hypothetical protein
LLLYAFTGFEMATIPAGEIKSPQKDLPRALLIAMAVIATTYILIQVVCIGHCPISRSRRSLWRTRAVTSWGQPAAQSFRRARIISVAGNLNITVLSASRVPYAIAEREQLPAFLGRVHKKILYAAHLDHHYDGVNAGADAEEFIRGGVDDQTIARLVAYRGDVRRFAGIEETQGRAHGAFQLAWWDSYCGSGVDTFRLGFWRTVRLLRLGRPPLLVCSGF